MGCEKTDYKLRFLFLCVAQGSINFSSNILNLRIQFALQRILIVIYEHPLPLQTMHTPRLPKPSKKCLQTLTLLTRGRPLRNCCPCCCSHHQTVGTGRFPDDSRDNSQHHFLGGGQRVSTLSNSLKLAPHAPAHSRPHGKLSKNLLYSKRRQSEVPLHHLLLQGALFIIHFRILM